MIATLDIINNFDVTINGTPQSAWQGTTAAAISDAMAITLAGRSKIISSILATDTGTGNPLLIYDDSTDLQISDIYYLWYKADQSTYIQLITASSGEVRIGPLAANVPISIGAFATLKLIATTGTTAMVNSAAPATADVKKIYIGNYSGSNANYVFGVFL